MVAQSTSGASVGENGAYESWMDIPIIIPVTSSYSPTLTLEIYPDELPDDPEVMLGILRDESADLSIWYDIALAYHRTALRSGDARTRALRLPSDALSRSGAIIDAANGALDDVRYPSDRTGRLRVLVSSGVFNVRRALSVPSSGSTAEREEHYAAADECFNRAQKIDPFFAMSFVGKGLMNLAQGRTEQARFFFDTTLKNTKNSNRGVLPALLGMAAVCYAEGRHDAAAEYYCTAITEFPDSPASVRVGLGLCCYRLGQVDRARACMERAVSMDPTNVEAIVGKAVLDLAAAGRGGDMDREGRTLTENAIKNISLANMYDNSNAMVQIHLANHYFWKWSEVPTSGWTVSIKGNTVTTSEHVDFYPGDEIRIGMDFATYVRTEPEVFPGSSSSYRFTVRDRIPTPLDGATLWRKDYERVQDMARVAYNSTSVPEIQSEALYLTGRVYHATGDYENAFKSFRAAVDKQPSLTPARYALAQLHCHRGEYEEALAAAEEVCKTRDDLADAQALRGLILARLKKRKEALGCLSRAAELTPYDPDAYLWHAAVLQSAPAGHAAALECYRRAVALMEGPGGRGAGAVPYHVWWNAGVLCHETKDYEGAGSMYGKALDALLAETGGEKEAKADCHHLVRHGDNAPFWKWTAVGTTSFEAGAGSIALPPDLSVSEGDRIRLGPFHDTAVRSVFWDSRMVELTDPLPSALEAAVTVTRKDGETAKLSETAAPVTVIRGSSKIIIAGELAEMGWSVGDEISLGDGFQTGIVAIEYSILVEEEIPRRVSSGNLFIRRISEESEEFEDTNLTVSGLEKGSNEVVVRLTKFSDLGIDKAGGDHLKIEGFEAKILGFDKFLVFEKKFPAKAEGVEFMVQHSNGALRSETISIAFNIACLHEATEKTEAAVELHKAIVKMHPSYKNSYMRLACISRDNGSIDRCSEWLQAACQIAPEDPEVLTLVGNLHFSLSDWENAQKIFDKLLASKDPNVEAYSQLSIANIYFQNLNVPEKYSKHLRRAAEFYRKMLHKDPSNLYAANGLGAILAEKGHLPRSKEIFSRVREVSGDSIPDALLNLGHVFLVQKRHADALQMYQAYMDRLQKVDDSDLYLYISFTYFDWAKLAEAYNSTMSAPADERYLKSIEFMAKAMSASKKENLILRYNWCILKLHYGHCVLQKLSRNISRTSTEVRNALQGLEESLSVVQQILKWSKEKRKIPITSNLLNTFVGNCEKTISAAKNHLDEELKKEEESKELAERHRLDAGRKAMERKAELQKKREIESRRQAEKERKAHDKLKKVGTLVGQWQMEAKASEAKKQRQKTKGQLDGFINDSQIVESDDDHERRGRPEPASDSSDSEPEKNKSSRNKEKVSQSELFGDDEDSDDEESDQEKNNSGNLKKKNKLRKGNSDVSDDDAMFEDDEGAGGEANRPLVKASEKDLFGVSSDEEESDEELVPQESSKAGGKKRPGDKNKNSGGGGSDSDGNVKKRRVLSDDEE